MIDLPGAIHGQPYVRPSFPAWLLQGGRVSLVVSAPPDVLAATIRANTASAIFHAFSSKPLIGRVSREGHILIGANTGLLSNGWGSFLDARIAPYNRGSLIEGRFRLSRYVLAFSIVWLGWVSLFVLTSVLSQAGTLSAGSLITAVLFPLFFLGIVAIARLFALGGEEKVVRQLVRLGTPDRPIG